MGSSLYGNEVATEPDRTSLPRSRGARPASEAEVQCPAGNSRVPVIVPVAAGLDRRTGGEDVEMPKLRIGGASAMTGAEEVKCEELVELVTDYLESVLEPAEVARIHKHLTVCDSCESYLSQVCVAIRVTSSLPSEEMTREAEEDILRIHQRWLAEGADHGS